MQYQEIKPCPFCACEDVAINTEKDLSRVQCLECRAYGPIVWKGNRIEAIETWNKRI